jgi:ABC-type polysaccharide/polyol phosphate export permease
MIQHYLKIFNLVINVSHLELSLEKKKSIIGNWWILINNIIIISLVGYAYLRILKTENINYIPHLAFGYILWVWISNSIIEACTVLLHSEGKIKQSNLDFFFYTFKSNYKNFIIFLHNFPLILFIVFFFKLKINFFIFFIFIFYIFLILLNIIFSSYILAVLVVRFRDIEKLLVSSMQVLFFLTPIIWMKEKLNEDLFFLSNLNVIYHWIESCRKILIYNEFSSLHFFFLILPLLIIFGIFLKIKKNVQNKLVFWF